MSDGWFGEKLRATGKVAHDRGTRGDECHGSIPRLRQARPIATLPSHRTLGGQLPESGIARGVPPNRGDYSREPGFARSAAALRSAESVRKHVTALTTTMTMPNTSQPFEPKNM